MSRLLAVFVHIASGTGVFCASAMEATALYQYRRATGAAQVQAAMNGFQAAHRAAPLTGAATLLSGAYLAQTVWGWRTAWIDVALACVVIVAVTSAVTAAPQLSRMRNAIQPHDSIPPASFWIRVGLLIGVLFLMTVKPPLDVSLLAVAAAALVGAVPGVRPFRSRASAMTAE